VTAKAVLAPGVVLGRGSLAGELGVQWPVSIAVAGVVVFPRRLSSAGVDPLPRDARALE